MSIKTMTIPLGKGVYKNVDKEALTDFDAISIDCYVDEMGYTRKRPGLLLFKDITNTLGVTNYPINGLFWWKHKSLGLVIAFGKVMKLSYASGYSEITDLTTSSLSLNYTPTFATDGTYAFIANGGQIVYTNGTANTAYIADADCPTTVTHVDWLDGYLLAAGDGTNRFYWSDVNSSLSWNALNYASAAGNSDIVIALKVFQRQVFLFGQTSVEIWENDGATPFIRTPGGFFNVGTIAPYSVVATDQAIYWLSDTRRIVRYVNGNIEAASTPYDKELSTYSSVSDCRAYRSVIDGKTFLIFVFPGASKTLVYSEQDNRWHEWGYWDVATGQRGRWLGDCVCWFPDWGIHLAGDRNTGLIYQMTPDYYSDNGNPIRMEKVTGFIDYGTRKNKRSEEIRLRAKRGVGGISRDPKLGLRWNSDGRGWSKQKLLSLGQEGDTNIVIDIARTGMFRTRQYEIVVTDDVPVSIGDGEEDITILR